MQRQFLPDDSSGLHSAGIDFQVMIRFHKGKKKCHHNTGLTTWEVFFGPRNYSKPETIPQPARSNYTRSRIVIFSA